MRPGFWQWQAKSVRDEHPSLVRGPTRHGSWGREVSVKMRSPLSYH
jgi:hypothetical protein